MSPFSIIHAALGLATLGIAAAVFLMRKGERRHRVLGWAYASLMIVSLAAILVRDANWRPFHGYAAFILCAVAAAVAASRWRGAIGASWRAWHATLMSLSALAALIATLGVIEGLIIGPQDAAGFYRAFNITIAVCTAAGLWFINTRTVIWGRDIARRTRTARTAFSALVAITSSSLIWSQWAMFAR